MATSLLMIAKPRGRKMDKSKKKEPERRTFIRRYADSARADVIAGKRSIYAGEWIERRQSRQDQRKG